MDIPCVKDCPDRSMDCHGKCEKYQAYAQWRAEERLKRAEKSRSAIRSSSKERAVWEMIKNGKIGRRRRR